MHQEELHDLESLLDHMEEASGPGERVSVNAMLEAVGRRSLGAVLLVPGLILVTPLSGVPGMATVMGLLTVLVAGQLLLGRHSFWLPRWILDRSVPQKRYCQALRLSRRPARFIDRFLRPRLLRFVRPPALQVIAALCVLAGLVLPILEFVPFAGTAGGLVLALFGLGLLAQDGALTAAGALICLGTLALAGLALL